MKRRRCEFIYYKKVERTEEELKALVTATYNLEWHRKYNSTYEKPVYADGYFHEWGLKLCEGTDSVTNYTVGVIEDMAGHIHTVQPEDIKFIGD